MGGLEGLSNELIRQPTNPPHSFTRHPGDTSEKAPARLLFGQEAILLRTACPAGVRGIDVGSSRGGGQ